MDDIQINLLLKARADLADIHKTQTELDTLAKQTNSIKPIDLSPLNPAALPALLAQTTALADTLATLNDLTPKPRAITAARDQYDAAHDGSALTAGEGIEAGVLNAANQLGSAGDNLSNLFSSTLLDSINAIGDGIYGWITGTQSFGDALRNLGDQVFKELLNTIIRIGAQWLINTLLVKTGIISIGATEDAVGQARTQKTVQQNAQVAASSAPGAISAGISSWGVALVFGALALAMILAAAGAFEAGGPINGRERIIRVNENGEEFMMNAAARRKYGDAFMHSVNAGTYVAQTAKSASGEFPESRLGSLRYDSIAARALAETPVAAASSPAAALAQARGNAPARAGQSGAAALASAMPKQEMPPINLYPFWDRDAMMRHILNSGDLDAKIVEVGDTTAWRRSG